MYNSKFDFRKYRNICEYNGSSFKSKYNRLIRFYYELFEFKNLISQKKTIAYNTFTRLYNEYLKTYFDEYNSITNVEKEVIDKKI